MLTYPLQYPISYPLSYGGGNISGDGMWFQQSSLALNGIMPTLIHDYVNNRYYTSNSGTSDFPFSTVRTTNAMQFDSAGRLIWAPANMIPNSSTSGAVVGVIGSGGALPTGWAWSTATGITREVLTVTANYIDVRLYGTNGTGALVYPQITALNTPVTATPTEGFCGSMYVQITNAANVSGFVASALKVNTQFLNGGAYVNEATPSSAATSSEERLVSKGSAPAAGINQVRVSLNLTVAIGGVVDVTLRIRAPQLEKQDITSPKTYIETTGTAIYKERLDYDPNTLAVIGFLCEESRTNLSPIHGEFGQSGYAYSGITGNPTLGSTGFGKSFHRITGDGALGAHYCSGGSLASAPTGSTVYTSSAYAKAGTQSLVQLTVSSGFGAADVYANFDLSNGTTGNVGAGVSNSAIVNCGNGIYRLSIAYTTIPVPAVGAASIVGLITALTDTRLPSNSLTTTVDLYGYQMELGSVATSLMPTFGVAVTRGADVPEAATAAWLTQGLGTLFIKYTCPKHPSGLFPPLVTIDDGTANNRIMSTFQSNTTNVNFGARIDDATVAQVNTTTLGTVDYYNTANAALAYSLNNTRMVQNGAAVTSDLVCTIPTVMNTLRVGKSVANTTTARWIKEIRYYPSVSASDAQLQALTT